MICIEQWLDTGRLLQISKIVTFYITELCDVILTIINVLLRLRNLPSV